jgi:predicted ArsR family transcriptional regulator
MANSALSSTEFSSLVTAVTSAFGDPTRREIYLFAREHDGEGVTATEVAKRFDLHANVARHHLDKLAGGGYLEVTLARPPTGAGRPSKHYRATAKGDDLQLHMRHDDVLVTLLGRALALLPPEQAEAMAEEVGEEYGVLLAASMGDVREGQRSVRSALHAVADALTAHGFAAHAERRSDELRIVSEHCPFGEAVLENPVICAVDRGMVKGLVATLVGTSDTTVALESSKPHGDDVCVTAVEV